MSEQITDAGTENTQDAAVAETTPQIDPLRSDVEELKSQNAALLAKIEQLVQGKTQPEAKEITPEAYQELLKSNPQKAIQLAVEGVVSQSLGKFTQEQQRTIFDQKAEADFPLLKSDKEFQKTVQSEMQDLISGGMSKDSPKLVYKAAQIAALKIKKSDGRSERVSGMSGEAPRSGGAPKAPAADKQFEALAAMFGVKDKEKMRARWEASKGRK